MKYVIDASVGFKWEVVESDSDKALRLRETFRRGIDDLLAPEIFSTEIANALMMAERRGRILAGQGRLYLADLLTTLPRLRPARCLHVERFSALVSVIYHFGADATRQAANPPPAALKSANAIKNRPGGPSR
jgi:predicted nucleic acid-binding protein